MSSDSKEVYVDPKDVQQVIELGDDKDNKDLDAGLENLDIKDDQSEINENNLFTDNENDGMYSEKDEKDETPDDSVEQFLQHTDSIFDVAFNPVDSTLVATGGCDDVGYMWDRTTGKALSKLDGHTDSVIGVKFSQDGKYLASAGMDGLIRVYEVVDSEKTDADTDNKDSAASAPAGKTTKHIQTLEGPSEEIIWFQWHPRGPVIIAGSSDTMVWMWKAVTGKCMRVFAGHLGPVLIGDWAIDGKLAVTGSEDGSAFVWSPKTGESVAHFKGKEYHDAPITALATATANTKNQNLILTGSADRDIIVARVGETDNQCKVLRKLRGHTDGVEGVCFASKLNYCASASLDASVAIWDLGTGQQRSRFKHDEGAVFCSFLDQFTAPGLKTTVHGPPDHLLLSCSLDQTVRLWDARSGKAVKTFRGHKNNVHRFSCSNDGKFVATACDDGASLVFEL